jgi:rRNA maturation RNase YbeY
MTLNAYLVEKAVKTTFAGEVREVEAITIILVDDERLREMKLEYFGMDQYTDVIAFNLNEVDAAVEGEIYMAPQQITANAREYEQPFTREFIRVIIHGVLHLCGYEDDTAELKAQMHGLEEQYLEMLNQPWSDSFERN